PAFYHQASFEIGGATPDRRFSWYFGTMGANQGYRYLNQFDGAGVTGFFYPFSIPTTNGYVYAPAPGATPALFSPGNAYGLSTTQDRETILNLHVAIPHHRDGGSDDLQLLYDTGGILDGFTSSVNDLGGPALFAKAGLGPLPWANGIVYTGPLMAPANAASFQRYYFPSSPATGMPDAVQPPNLRDTNANGFAVVKLQYQRNFSSSAFLRIFGYTMYSSWFEYGPVSANLPWGDSVADYENIAHTGGVNAKFVDQVAPAHLLTAAGSWSSSTMMRYSTTGGFPASSIGSYANAFVGSNGLCYNWKTGAQIGCYDACVNPSTGVDQTGGCASSFTPLRGTIPSSPGGSIFSPSPAYACGGPAPPPACAHDPRWLMTTNGYSANLDTVAPVFTAGAIDDYWSPSDRFSLKAGLRAETYTYDLANTAVGNPARAFWFNSYNAQYCFGPGLAEPVLRTPNKQGALLGPCPANTTPVNMADASGGTLSSTQWQPRLGAVDAMGSNDVLRASWGVYAQPANTAWAQFNTVQPDLAHYLGTEFLGYGFNTPVHDERPARSYNSDLSWEHHFKDTGVSFKLTPFYRSTADQLQSFDINSLTGLRSGLNVGRQVSQGVEFQLQAGDPTHDGWNAQLSYTYTHSRIRFSNFSNGRNVIDNLNNYIQQYNSYTKACRIPDPALCGTYAGNARPVFDNGGTIVANPYYDNPAQPLLDRNAWYVPYDVIPAPFAGANGHDFPNVAALVVGYKHDRWTITPTLALTSGAEYGSPLVWPGYVPQFCTQVNRGTRTAIGSSCASGPATVAPLPYIFTPDPYSGRFDDLGAFRQPSEITLNIASSYRVSPRVTARVELLDLVDHCILRGYAWETPGICTYAELPSSALAPAGNFVPLASAPPQLRYPYGMWLNNTEVGALGTSVPMQAIFEVDVSL
ncbi:MAG: hypothetical protein JO199_04650, partial [Candidatus Eremiobacteraeota bacterium]|nr:hypothetical protein [Candidatus Eremiobacteraeota bacterium]